MYMAKVNKIMVTIPTEKIHPHPQNPRKSIKNVDELADSLKKNGIMQNLTVVPKEDAKGEYLVLIGHRRLEACKKAGITEVPCRIIKGLTLEEQVGRMLEENMQRDDLEIWEQAQGFQMMLDLGSTEEELVEKTGFSKQTIRHRLNLAKLDGEELKSKDESIQLTLKELYELEKVKNIDDRNEILKKAQRAGDIRLLVASYLEEKELEKKAGAAYEVLKGRFPEMEVIPISDTYKRGMHTLLYSNLRDMTIDEVREKMESVEIPGKAYYRINCGWIYLYSYVEPKEEKKTEEQLKKEEERKKKKSIEDELDNMFKGIVSQAESKIRKIIQTEEYRRKNNEVLLEQLWKVALNLTIQLREDLMIDYAIGDEKETEENVMNAKKYIEGIGITGQLLILIADKLEDAHSYIVNYKFEYDEKNGKRIMEVCRFLEQFGLKLKEEEYQVLDGTHEMFGKVK